MDTNWRMAGDQHAKRRLFYAMFCGESKDVLRITVCSTYITGTPECRTIRMLFENVNISSYAASSFGLVSSVVSSRARICYLTGSVLNDIWIFRKLFYHGCFEMLPLAVRHSLWFQHNVASTWYGEDFPQKFSRMYRKIGSWGQTEKPPYLPDLNLMCLYMGTPKGVCLSSAFQDYPVCRINTSGRYKQSQPMCLGKPCSALLSAFKRQADASKFYIKYEASMVWSSLSSPTWR
jgi:hypothetical protein